MIPDLSSRRRQLSEQIARQRQELGSAYRNLAKPFQYAESSLAGLKVLRKSGWLLALAPSAVSLAFSFFGWEKKGQANWLDRFRHKAARGTEKLKSLDSLKLKKPIARLGGHAWSIFQLYRKIGPSFREQIDSRAGSEALGDQARHRHPH